MADLVDAANDLVEAERIRGLTLVRISLQTNQPSKNVCRNCDEETVSRNFCSIGCRDDFEVMQKHLLIRGAATCN